MGNFVFFATLFCLFKAIAVFCGANVPFVGAIIWADLIGIACAFLLPFIFVKSMVHGLAPHQKQEYYRLKEMYEHQRSYLAEICARKLFKRFE